MYYVIKMSADIPGNYPETYYCREAPGHSHTAEVAFSRAAKTAYAQANGIAENEVRVGSIYQSAKPKGEEI